MAPFTETVADLETEADRIRVRRYGVIEMSGLQLAGICLRPFPKLLSLPEVIPVSHDYHCRGPSGRCWLYYNQPRRYPNFLALKYVVSTQGTKFSTFRAALTVLDAVARIKRSDALLCDVGNARISDRLLARWGWEAHKPQRRHRNFIKRFYGTYPEIDLSFLPGPATIGAHVVEST